MKDREKATGQRERFEQAARELGVEIDEEKLREALRKMASHTPAKSDEASDEHSQS